MLNCQLVKDRFGQHYKIQTHRDQPVQASLNPERFYSDLQASRFIGNLIVPISYWRNIYQSASLLERPAQNDAEITALVATLLSTGKIRAYKVDIPSHIDHPPEKRTITDGDKNRHTFTSAGALLISTPKEVLTFSDKKEADKYLKELSPDRVTLQTLIKELNLPRTERDDDFGELLDIVSTGLASGEIVVFLDSYTTPPASSGSSDDSTMQGDKDASQGPESPDCTFDTMIVQCDHNPKDRSYKLDVIKDKPNLNGVDKALQVIAKPGDPDKIKVSFSGSCGCGNKDCPSVSLDSPPLTTTSNKNPFEFEVLPRDEGKEISSFTDFLKYCLIPDLSDLHYEVYTVSKAGCNGSEGYTAKIYTFPTFKWGGSVSFGYGQKDGGKEKNKSNLTDPGEWKLEAKLSGEIGQHTYEFNTDKASDTDSFFPSLKGKISDLIEKIDQISQATDEVGKDVAKKVGIDHGKDLVEFKALWPKITLAGNMELKEAVDDFDVDVGGDVSLAMSPLFGAQIKTDIISWLIRWIAGPQSTFIEEIRSRIEDKASLKIDFIVEGKVEADLKWSKDAHEKWLSTAGEKKGAASLGVTFKMVGEAKVSAEVFYVKITAGFTVAIAGNTDKGADEGVGVIFSLYATTNKDYPAIGGNVTFTGIAIHFSYYAEIGGKGASSDDPDSSRRRLSDKHETNNSAKGQVKRKVQSVLKSWTLPEKPDAGSSTLIENMDY